MSYIVTTRKRKRADLPAKLDEKFDKKLDKKLNKKLDKKPDGRKAASAKSSSPTNTQKKKTKRIILHTNKTNIATPPAPKKITLRVYKSRRERILAQAFHEICLSRKLLMEGKMESELEELGLSPMLPYKEKHSF